MKKRFFRKFIKEYLKEFLKELICNKNNAKNGVPYPFVEGKLFYYIYIYIYTGARQYFSDTLKKVLQGGH